MPEETPEGPEGIGLTINGQPVVARPGELLIDAAERHGVYIPRFCYHSRMRPVGMCRMCIVEVDTGRGPTLQPSCMLECTPGMVVDTTSEVTTKAQDGVLEFLLINHPLDCPVCDKGGECPLQDQTMAYGPGESRFVEEKRHFEKPIPVSDLVLLDRERCILCDRCTRFAKEVAGDPLIHFVNRGNHTEVNTFPDHPFASYFSGNTVQICPVGALTSTAYRFKARPWDLEEVESTCTTCALGCRMAVQSSRNEVTRYLGVDADAVNWGWLCDKGRYGYEAVNAEDRLGQPLLRSEDGQRFEEVPWSRALREAADLIRDAVGRGGPGRVALLGGAPLTNESAYAWTKLAKGVIATDHVDAQLGDGLPAEVVLGLPRATLDEALAPGSTVVLLGPDLKEELPVLHLRLRHAVLEDGVKVVELSPRATSSTPLAAVALHPRPGEMGDLCRVLAGVRDAADARELERLDRDAVAQASMLLRAGPVTVLLGRPSVAESAADVTDAAAALVTLPNVRFCSTLRRANVHGALDMGMAPGILPGRVSLDDARDHYAAAWPTVPGGRGHDARGILEAAAAGEIDVLLLVGSDPLGDFPDRTLAAAALRRVPAVVAVDRFVNPSGAHARVVLPAAGFAEVAGTTTNLEGRVTPVAQKVTPPGTARDDWMIAADLSRLLGVDLGLESVEGIRAEVRALAPAWAGLSEDLLADHAREGICLPVAPEATGEADDQTDDQADDQADDGVVAELPPVLPPMLRFESRAEPSAPHKNDSYSLRLIASRRLYDDGVLVQRSPHLAGLPAPTVLAVNPYDFDRIGVAPGSEVFVTSVRGTRTLRLEPDAGVPRGAAAASLGVPPFPLAELLDVTAPVTEVRVDSEEPQ